MWKWPIADAGNNLVTPFDDCNTSRVVIKYDSRDVFSRHDWELCLKECLEPGEDDERPWFVVVFHWHNPYDSFS